MSHVTYDIVILAQEKMIEAIVEKSAVAFSIERGGQMPRKPKRPCSHPGCPNLTDGRFCETHVKQHNQNYEKYERDKSTKRRYGRCWKRIRDKYVLQHPFCELCYEKGVLVETEEVHHKKKLSDGGTHDRDNLIALCKSCHSRIHVLNGDRWKKETIIPDDDL